MSTTLSSSPVARPGDATNPSPRRVLVLGRSAEVMETVLQELAEAGVSAAGATDPEQAVARWEPGSFELIAFGGGLKNPAGEDLKRRLRDRDPHVQIIDTRAPLAAHQIVTVLGQNDPQARVALEAYFARIGYAGNPAPTLETLRALQQRHPAAIPFEAMDVLMDRGVDLEPSAVDAKLIARHRGGYCFEQNGLLLRVLKAIGFEVEGLLARVRWMSAAGGAPAPATHMALRVTVAGDPWLVDVGFGSAVPTAPLRLNTVAPQVTAHETFRVIPFGNSRLLQARLDDRWASLYEVLPEPAVAADYQAANWFTSTHPSSHFRQVLTAARTTPETRYALRGNRFTVRTPAGEVERRFLDADGIDAVLRDTFALPVADDWRPVIEQAAETAEGAAT